MTSESTPVEKGHDFATSTGTLDREEMSEPSDISTEKAAAAAGSPTENTMMRGVTDKVVTSSSFPERVENTLENFFPITMGTGTSDEVDIQEEEEDNEEIDDVESQVSLNSSTHEEGPRGRTHGRGNSSSNATRDSRPGVQRIPEEVLLATGRSRVNDLCEKRMRPEEVTPRTWNQSNQETSQPSDSDRRGMDNNDQAGHSRDATAMATTNRSLKTFLTRLYRTSERKEKSRKVFKKARCYKEESDGCIDTWIEVMKHHFEGEDLMERQECGMLTSNLEGTALICVMDEKQYQLDTAEKIFEIL